MRRSDDPGGLLPVGGGFVGRERELDRIGALLMGSTRLVTLLGPGGIGKTRLAEEAARRLHRARRTPVFVVRLARVPKGSDAAAVREVVAGSVLVEGFVDASAWDGVMRTLSLADAVLVLDNCEHVLAGAGQVIADLLDVVPGLTILATSREPVGWVDEQLVTVPPLSAEESLELFGQRAEMTGHSITDADHVRLAEQICWHMHGNPLYIRLAAARMFYESLPMILEQVSGEADDVRMRWRHGPRVGSEDRHRAIADVIAWSYELCGDKQRLLFDRLSVFAPGYDANPEDDGTDVGAVGVELEAIEAVCADDVAIEGCEALPSSAGGPAVGLAREEIRTLLEQLVDQSLVTIHVTADAVRYSLLESLRLFASDRLAERSTDKVDEPARLARRHCHYYRDKVLHVPAEWYGSAEQERLNWVRGAWSNIRRAIDFSLEGAGQAEMGLEICVGLLSRRALFYLGSLPEIRSRVEQTLAATQGLAPRPTELRLAAMAMMVWLAVFQGHLQEAEELLERCVAAYGAPADHRAYWREQRDIDTGLPAVVDFACAQLMFARRDPRAIAVFARARVKFRSMADSGGEAMSGMFEALAAGFYGSADQAMDINRRHLEQATASGAGWSRSRAQLTLAIALTKHGNPAEALKLCRTALAGLLPVGDNWGAGWAVHIRMWALARLVTDQVASANPNRRTLVKSATEIASLAGGLETQRARLGMAIDSMGPFADETSAAEEVARDVLGQKAYTEAKKWGSRLSGERSELERLALGTLSINTSPVDHPASTGTSSDWQILSKAEREVAILAAAGWHNSAIGVRRGTSTRTVDAQISKIFEKLMINSREDIVRFVPEDQRDRLAVERSHRPHPNEEKPRPGQSRRHS